MSSVITDRRESSGTKLEISANCGCFCPEEESLKSRNQELLHHNLLPCNYLLSCVCLLFPTHYFDNSIVKQIHPVAILLMQFDIWGSILFILMLLWLITSWSGRSGVQDKLKNVVLSFYSWISFQSSQGAWSHEWRRQEERSSFPTSAILLRISSTWKIICFS